MWVVGDRRDWGEMGLPWARQLSEEEGSRGGRVGESEEGREEDRVGGGEARIWQRECGPTGLGREKAKG